MQEKSSPEFSERLRAAMLSAGVKATSLASKAGISKGYVSGLLGKTKAAPSFEVVKKFSEVLQCSPQWLLYGMQQDQETATMLRDEPAKYFTSKQTAIELRPTLDDAMALMRQALRIMEEIQRNQSHEKV